MEMEGIVIETDVSSSHLSMTHGTRAQRSTLEEPTTVYGQHHHRLQTPRLTCSNRKVDEDYIKPV